ncbi:unnamed protein product [Linum trigynum]|uniref:Uncharacterized protein n=1 Tax=Linum trigynum TaxID=586398 RepID=A0AAV2FZR8_9ROSI
MSHWGIWAHRGCLGPSPLQCREMGMKGRSKAHSRIHRRITTRMERGPYKSETRRLRACHLAMWSLQASGAGSPGAATWRRPTVGPYRAFNDALTWS